MPTISNTFTTASARVNRESLANIASRITPEDTPIYTEIGKESASATFPEWVIDELAAPADNAQMEGDVYTYGAVTPGARVGNYTQIMRKEWIISKSQEAADNAAQVEQIKTQKIKKAIEIRKDTELAIVSNTASVAGATRRMGGLPSWYTSNVSRGGGGGANGGYNTGTKLTVAATNGTQRAFTKALLDSTMQLCYEAGANVSMAVVSPYVKSVFVTFMSDSSVAAFRYSAGDGGKNTLVATADYYEGPFGRVMVVPNRVMTTAATARNVHLLDPEMLSMKVYRQIASDPNVVTNADATAGVIIGEHTLCVKNQAGLGVVADVFGLTAST
jgi:hypothetical protein